MVHTGSFSVPSDMKHDPAGPKPNEVVVLVASDGKGHNGGIPNVLDEACANRKEYCELQGYQYQFLNITKFNIGNSHAVWAKLPAIVETFNLHPEAKWVWWLDLDAIIMDPTIDLVSHVLSHKALEKAILKNLQLNRPRNGKIGLYTSKNPDLNNIDLIISQDHNGINAGSFMIRRSEFTKFLIDMWRDPLYIQQNDWISMEQDALVSSAGLIVPNNLKLTVPGSFSCSDGIQ